MRSSIFTGLAAASALMALTVTGTAAQENYESWALLQSTFIVGNKCVTNFTATEPSGKIYYNMVEFDAVPAQGGILCTDGKWRAVDGSASGTTPLRVFIKDGVSRRSP